MCFASYFEVYRVCKAYVFSFIHCHEMPSHCFFFFTVNSSVNAARSSLNHVYLRKFDGKGIKFIKTFRLGYVISLNVVVVKSNSDVLTVLGSSSAQYLFFPSFFLFFFSFLFCFVVFL